MSLDRGTWSRPISISPPPKRRRTAGLPLQGDPGDRRDDQNEPPFAHETPQDYVFGKTTQARNISSAPPSRTVSSPVRLNFIEQLPQPSNIDTVSLGSILGNVMIQECWLFNYLFDLDFVMSQFDPDIKNLVKVHVVHGSWRKEDMNKINIDEAARCYANVDVITAYMPEAFGTHHSKMIVLFRHDDLAQVVILTGNFIERDWCMSQAIWQSPLLPLLRTNAAPDSAPAALYGSGLRFKHDLMSYFKAYGVKLKDLTARLGRYDFNEIKAALIASTPGKQNPRSMDPDTETLWGWPGLKQILSSISKQTTHNDRAEQRTTSENDPSNEEPQIVIQVSSVASLGEKWLTTTLFPALAVRREGRSQSPDSVIFKQEKPRYSVVFPTAETIRKSVGGYGSGASIHMKTQTPAQAKQLSDLRPMLCHWAGATGKLGVVRAAGRKRAAPHIKTYIRFSDASMQQIDWAMVTSANLSTQAWGSAISAAGDIRICSYEIGVIVWPGLWNGADDGGTGAIMVPVFGRDTPAGNGMEEDHAEASTGPNVPGSEQNARRTDQGGDSERKESKREKTVVGFRMPYDLPLVPYGRDEMPWCATEPCREPDWMGRIWPGAGHR